VQTVAASPYALQWCRLLSFHFSRT